MSLEEYKYIANFGMQDTYIKSNSDPTDEVKAQSILDLRSLSREHQLNYITSVVQHLCAKSRLGCIMEGPATVLSLEEICEVIRWE
jgi:hypothetical protein